jgi:hypothetical protein
MKSKTISALSAVLANLLLVLTGASGPALALQNSAFPAPSAKTQSPVGFPVQAPELIERAAQLAEMAKASLDQCIATLDLGTHITPGN